MKIPLIGAVPSKPKVVFVQGEEDQRAALARVIQQQHRLLSKLTEIGEP